MNTVPEADWKVLKRIKSAALDRLCTRILSGLARIRADESKSPHERYLDTFAAVRDGDRQIALAFDDLKRSTAFLKIAQMRSMDLLTDEEFSQFSDATREIVVNLTSRNGGGIRPIKFV